LRRVVFRAAGLAVAATAAPGIAMTELAAAVPARLRGLDVAFLAFAVAMNYLPVRMSRNENGGAYIHRLIHTTYGT
jgi:hypothetical protein